MKRKHIAIAAAVAVLAALLVWIVAFRDGGTTKSGGGASGPDRGAIDPKRGGRGGVDAPDREDPGRAFEPTDPEGTLLLEGQVLGEDEQPVAGAEVWISSQPRRTATTEGDGSFSFDKLLPREYAVGARSGDAIGGPVVVKLGPDLGPVVVRLREGAGLVVRVSDESGAAVKDASVEVEEAGGRTGTTDADGRATFRGLPSGFSFVEVRASGFAPASALVAIGAPGSTQELAVVVRKGAAISGTVVDEGGQPVGDAWVTIEDASAGWGGADDGTTSAADGSFRFAVIAAGSYTITARHRDHAPGTSEIVSVDGMNDRGGVEVRLKAPAVLRGRVVTSRKEPAPFASVELAMKQGGQSEFGFGQTLAHATCDGEGKFEIKNLPRVAVRVHAENDEAGSTIVDVDLEKTPTVDDLELVLDVEGMIAGIVVDAKGEPVAEAQVSASPDVFTGDGMKNAEDLVFSGFTATTTDGGGAFRLRGLPEGSYLLWASRSGAPVQAYTAKGTPAKTGDMEVKIVLPAPGGIEGRIAFANGDAPKRAIVQIGVLPATPADGDGSFSARDLPPGLYDLHVRGPDFAEVVKRDVEVKAGAVTDVGTITVARGRTLAGRVVDGAGNGIPGARVLAGEILFSQGNAGEIDPAIVEQAGLRSAISGSDGAFLILGAPVKGGSILAEDLEKGRSDAITFPPGDGDVTGMTLTLRGYGSVGGTVTRKGEALGNVQVLASAKGSSGHIVVVETGADGSYVIDKIPEGEHRVSAQRLIGFQTASAGVDVEVEAGKRAVANIVFPVGTVTLTVKIAGKSGAKIDAAQMWLFQGTVVARTAKDIVDRSLGGDTGNANFWFGGPDFPTYPELVAGAYSVCVLPINGDLADQQFQQRLREHLEHLAVVCVETEVEATPDAQSVTVTSPAMTPLPAD